MIQSPSKKTNTKLIVFLSVFALLVIIMNSGNDSQGQHNSGSSELSIDYFSNNCSGIKASEIRSRLGDPYKNERLSNGNNQWIWFTKLYYPETQSASSAMIKVEFDASTDVVYKCNAR